MNDHNYEIEIKSLLGNKERADQLKAKMSEDPSFVFIGSHEQLNHYFEGGNLKSLYENASDLLEADKKERLKGLTGKSMDYSVRTRWADGTVILVVKASINDNSSSNSTQRLEWEAKVNIPLDELDKLVLNSGFTYQAKWSRKREDFKYKGANVSIDKNAGYGYVSEFEMVIDDKNKADETKQTILQIMKDLEIEELPQDRLGRMFDYYNKNWSDYYGTENIFVID